MSKKASPTLIGLFFVGGLALGIAGLLAFSSRSLFSPQAKYILYFNGSLKGLNVGAPVKFRGVNIGQVTEIMIRHNQANNDHAMPVLISVDKKLAQSKSDRHLRFDSARMAELFSQGYRGRLDAESLVTGVLYVEFDVVPNCPPAFFHQLVPEYEEIPTVPSTVQQLLADLAQFDLPGLSDKVLTVLNQLETMLGQVDVSTINAGVTNLLDGANRLVVASDLTNTLASLKITLNSAGTLLKRVDGRIDSIADGATNTLSEAQKALADLRVTLRGVSDLLGPDSAIPPELRQALEEISNAGRAIAALAEYLEKNPNALLTGRKRSRDQR